MLIIEFIILCLLFFIICYSNTGTDEKNIKSYTSYPDKVQELINGDPYLKSLIKEPSPMMSFISNMIVFGFIIRSHSFFDNFINLIILGEGVNAFDFLVIDMLWWRNTPRIRFQNMQDKEIYQDYHKHLISFIKGIGLFMIIALIDCLLLSLI